MNYQLISIPVVLRDYVDVKADVEYKSLEHEMLVDIADSLYNVGIPVEAMQEKYQKAYATQTPEFWASVLKDVKSLSYEVSSHDVHDLLDEYKALLKVSEIMKPFTIEIYDKDSFDMVKVRFWYDQSDGEPLAWRVTGLRNGGHVSNSYSDTFSDKYINYNGEAALELARNTLKSVIGEA